jgi:hypothetical protein
MVGVCSIVLRKRSVIARRLMPPWLAFTSVYFFESRLFNGLRPIQIKKLSWYPFSRRGLSRELALPKAK